MCAVRQIMGFGQSSHVLGLGQLESDLSGSLALTMPNSSCSTILAITDSPYTTFRRCYVGMSLSVHVDYDELVGIVTTHNSLRELS